MTSFLLVSLVLSLSVVYTAGQTTAYKKFMQMSIGELLSLYQAQQQQPIQPTSNNQLPNKADNVSPSSNDVMNTKLSNLVPQQYKKFVPNDILNANAKELVSALGAQMGIQGKGYLKIRQDIIPDAASISRTEGTKARKNWGKSQINPDMSTVNGTAASTGQKSLGTMTLGTLLSSLKSKNALKQKEMTNAFSMIPSFVLNDAASKWIPQQYQHKIVDSIIKRQQKANSSQTQ